MPSYNVLKSDGTTLTTVTDGVVNSTAASIKFIGRTIVDYGQDIAENQVHIMENFANTVQPSNPVAGQLWWDTSIDVLKVHDGANFDRAFLQNIVEDLSPQLGANLDANTFDIEEDGNVILSFTSGGELATNWVDVVHATTGSGPIIRSVGADTNVDLNLSAKGTGIVNLGSGGVKLNAPLDVNSQALTNVDTFSVNNEVVISFTSGVEEGVNWVDIVTAELSQGPIIRSVGAASNIDLNISAKGTGIVNLGSGGVKLNAPLNVNNQAFTNVGSFSFGNGVVLSFASGGELGANWVDVAWAEAGSGPVIRSVGADTNVDLVLDTKGTGDIDASSNKIINVGNPVGLQDAATKAYADNNFSTITRTVNAQTGTTYTLVLGDTGDVVTMDNVSANTLTIPTNASVAFAIGVQIEVIMKGAGVTTVTGDTGVTVNGVSAGGATIDAQYKTVTILKVATDTWIMFGAHGTVA